MATLEITKPNSFVAYEQLGGGWEVYDEWNVTDLPILYAKELAEVVSFARDHQAELTVLTNEWAESWLLS